MPKGIRGQEAEEARILGIAEYIQHRLGMDWMRITHKFNSRTDGENETAEAVCHWEYRQGSIIWNTAYSMTVPDDELERVAIHEHVHLLLAPLWENIPDEVAEKEKLQPMNELATENVTQAISKAMDALR